MVTKNNKVIIIMSMFAVMMVMGFCVGCSSSQEKPSEEVMKDIIMKLYECPRGSTLGPHWEEFGGELSVNPGERLLSKYKDESLTVNIEQFKIIKGFFSKSKGNGGESTLYCIEVNFKLQMLIMDNIAARPKRPKWEHVYNNEKITFVKRGDKWYGKKGWEVIN